MSLFEGHGLQPDKGTEFTGYPFELNRCGNENKEQTKSDGKSPPPSQERQSKKQQNKGQGRAGSSGPSGSGAASASASGNDESHVRHLEKLKAILKAAKKSLKTMNQEKNIDDFYTELEELYRVNPGLLEEKGSLESREYRWKAILRLLQLYFPGKLEKGEMTHILFDYPEFKTYPEKLIRLFTKAMLPELALPEELSSEESIDRLLGTASLNIIKLMHTYLGMHQCLHQLFVLFLNQLPLMATEEPKNYIFQDKTGHVIVFSIRRNSKGHYRIFVVDSLSTFKHYCPEQTHSPMSHFVALALTLAIKYHGFTDSRFFFLPRRQVSAFGCESFMLHDLETLLESPMLAQNGYYADKEPLAKENMLNFFLQIMYLEGTKQLGQLVINGVSKDFIETADQPAFDMEDLDSFIVMALSTWKESGLEPDLVKLYQLRQFPPRFAHLTQGQQNLKRLLEKFPKERQKEVNQVIDETRGFLSVNDRTCHNKVNLAATLLWMKMNIDLLDMPPPGQEK
ncbi:hypothetical protein [Endozoicomonas sp. 8E]|uniref:hypothetical protein n=1 Tax=Endozoicomonas sp. 8E TaxID=3035692 RepID=UPI002938F612|nr:hypothetical protein [Endozoicomonas sp. 8E]WOG27247.1 hypothetical protein P6910_22285 [Endozoicomonas sp. 8E]